MNSIKKTLVVGLAITALAVPSFAAAAGNPAEIYSELAKL